MKRRMKRRKTCLSHLVLEKRVWLPGLACGNPSLHSLDLLILHELDCGLEVILKSPWLFLCKIKSIYFWLCWLFAAVQTFFQSQQVAATL